MRPLPQGQSPTAYPSLIHSRLYTAVDQPESPEYFDTPRSRHLLRPNANDSGKAGDVWKS
jgi:hypothetical protein